MRSGARAALLTAMTIAALTVAASILIARDFKAQHRARFLTAAIAAEELVRDRLEMQIALLHAGAGLFAAAPETSCRGFADFLQRMELEHHYPGTLGVGYSELVSPERLPEVEAEGRAAGIPEFRVWPETPREEYHVIRCLEPLDRRNRAALGYDMYTDDVRRTAMARARDTGDAATSGRVELVQEIDENKQAGFLIYAPIYAGGTPPPTVDERRRQFRGFVYSPLRADDFLRGIFGAADPRVRIEVFDGAGTDPAELLHRSAAPISTEVEPVVRTLDVAGRRWTLRFTPTPSLQSPAVRGIIVGVLAGGLLLALLLYRALTRAQVAATEAARADERARQSNELAQRGAEQLASIMDAVPALVSFIDLDERYVVANRRYEDWFGLQRADVEGRTVRELLGPEAYERVRDAIAAARAGTPASREVTLRRRQGDDVHALATYTPQRGADGVVRGVTALVLDVTDLKRARDAVAASEANLRAILDTSLDGVVQMDRAGRVTYWNPRAEEMFGWTAGEARGRMVRELIVPPGLRDAHRDGVDRFLATGEARILGRRIEVPAIRKDGREIPVELTITAVGAGNDLQFNAFLADLSGRNRARAARRFLTEAATALSATLDRERILVLVSSLAVPALARGAVVVSLEDPSKPRVMSHAGDLSDDAAAALAARLAGPDGLEAGGALIVPLAVGARAAGALVLVGGPEMPSPPDERRAVAEEYARRAAIALHNAELYEDAQTANRLKDDFLSNLSHELRTPANAILGWAQMARDGIVTGEGATRALDAVLRNARTQQELISDILDAQRLATGKLRLALEPIDARGVVADAVEALRPTAGAKGITLEQSLDGPAPVLADADRLQQVLWNLLTNAVKFTSDGGVVDVSCRRSDATVRIEVRDSGPGIPASFLPHVFERFRQADGSATKGHGGLGLGLAIARNLTELHGGTIEAANRSDGQTGAVFTVSLPVDRARAPEAEGP